MRQAKMLNRALIKLHYMQKHPCRNFGPLKRDFLQPSDVPASFAAQIWQGKIQNKGQSAGN